MRLKAFLAVMLVLGALLLAAGSSVAGSIDGTFLNEPASSISQIITQVEDNRLVALRYAKHFETEPSSVLNYMRMELDVRTLDKETTCDVYYIDNTQNIAKKSIVLHAGTKVFANNAGIPILEYGSGNPLTDQLSTKSDLKDLTKPQNAKPSSNTAPGTIGQSPADTKISTASENSSNVKNLVASLPTPSGVVPASSAVTSGGSISRWLVPLGVIGGAVAILGGRGGSPPDIIRTEPVPEPTGFMVLGSGVMAFSGFAFRRRRI